MATAGEVNNSKSRAKADAKEPLLKIVSIKVEDEEFQGTSGNRGSLEVLLFSTFVAVLGSFEFGKCVGYTAPIQSAIREDLELSLAEFSLFGSILAVGSMIGAITSGPIAEFMGRKGAMGISAVLSTTGWTAIYFSQEALLLDAGRFLTGYAIGVSSYVVPTYIAEIAPKDLRGRLATTNQIMIVIGVSTVCLLGTVLTWRILAITATSFRMKDYNLLTEWIPLLVLGGVLLYIGSFSIGMGAVPWVIMSEIFPVNIKGAAGSLVNLVHWFGVWTVSYTFNFLVAWSSPGTFYLYSGFCAAAVLFVAKAVPETKGRTLEQIQASLNS